MMSRVLAPLFATAAVAALVPSAVEGRSLKQFATGSTANIELVGQSNDDGADTYQTLVVDTEVVGPGVGSTASTTYFALSDPSAAFGDISASASSPEYSAEALSRNEQKSNDAVTVAYSTSNAEAYLIADSDALAIASTIRTPGSTDKTSNAIARSNAVSTADLEAGYAAATSSSLSSDDSANSVAEATAESELPAAVLTGPMDAVAVSTAAGNTGAGSTAEAEAIGGTAAPGTAGGKAIAQAVTNSFAYGFAGAATTAEAESEEAATADAYAIAQSGGSAGSPAGRSEGGDALAESEAIATQSGDAFASQSSIASVANEAFTATAYGRSSAEAGGDDTALATSSSSATNTGK